MKKKKILVLAPHTDDGELGAGGYIYQSIKNGFEVLYIAFSDCKKSILENFDKNSLSIECKHSTKLLGIDKLQILNFEVREFPEKRQQILDHLIKLKKEFAPDEVLTPSRFDIHQDHQTITNEAIRAFKSCSILGYELPWNCLKFDLDYFVELSEESINKKIEALKMYKSQKHRPYFKDNFFLNHAKCRGTLINTAYAEVFEVIRKVERLY